MGVGKENAQAPEGGLDVVQAETLRTALQKTATILYNNPCFILETLAEVERKVRKAEAASSHDDDPSFDSAKVSTFRSLLDEWVASWLQSQSAGLLTDQLLHKVIQRSPANFERLKVFACQLPNSMVWNQKLMVKKVAARSLEHRARELSNLVSREWVQKAIDVTGEIRWHHGWPWSCRGSGRLWVWDSLCKHCCAIVHMQLCDGCVVFLIALHYLLTPSPSGPCRLLQLRLGRAPGHRDPPPLGRAGRYPHTLLHRQDVRDA